MKKVKAKKEVKRKVLPKLVQHKTKKVVEENPVYIQISSNEAMNSEKDTLAYQMELIRMVKSIKRYGVLREGETSIKINLKKTVKEVNDNIRKIESNFPKAEGYVPKEKAPAIKEVKIEYYDQNLETQLEQIRRKLEEIGK